MTHEDLMRELLAERYGPGRQSEPRHAAAPIRGAGDGGPDSDIAFARRRRVLCEALDEVPQGFRRRQRSA